MPGTAAEKVAMPAMDIARNCEPVSNCCTERLHGQNRIDLSGGKMRVRQLIEKLKQCIAFKKSQPVVPAYQTNAFVHDQSLCGRYVAFPSFNDRSVITSGYDMARVYNDAVRIGYPKPLVIYVPRSDVDEM